MAENQVTDEPSIESLNSKLDELFERYLSLLDEYQTAREQLSSQFSTVGSAIYSQLSELTSAGLHFSSTSQLCLINPYTIWPGLL